MSRPKTGREKKLQIYVGYELFDKLDANRSELGMTYLSDYVRLLLHQATQLKMPETPAILGRRN